MQKNKRKVVISDQHACFYAISRLSSREKARKKEEEHGKARLGGLMGIVVLGGVLSIALKQAIVKMVR